MMEHKLVGGTNVLVKRSDMRCKHINLSSDCCFLESGISACLCLYVCVCLSDKRCGTLHTRKQKLF